MPALQNLKRVFAENGALLAECTRDELGMYLAALLAHEALVRFYLDSDEKPPTPASSPRNARVVPR